MAKRKNTERTPEENEAISNKVDDLLSEGFELDQATAIAFRMFRDGELKIPFKTSLLYRQQRMKKKSLLEQIKIASEFLGLDKLLQNENKTK